MLGLGTEDLVVDIGSNDGTLLSNFQTGGHRVLGIEPTDVGDIANKRGIPTLKRYFGAEVAREVKRDYRPARVVTATVPLLDGGEGDLERGDGKGVLPISAELLGDTDIFFGLDLGGGEGERWGEKGRKRGKRGID